MAYTQRQSIEVIRKLPRCIEVELQEGSYRGKTQLYAEYDHGPDPYKLVVADAVVTALQPRRGQKWLAHPDYTPNGYIIFCGLTAIDKEVELRTAQAATLGFVHPDQATWEMIKERIQELGGDGLMGVEEQHEFHNIGRRFNRCPAVI